MENEHEKREIIIFASSCAFFILFIILAICFIKPNSEKKEMKYININVDYEVINYSQSVRDNGNTENQDTTINFVTPSGEHHSVTVTNEIESNYSNFGKLTSKNSQLRFVSSDYHDIKDMIAGTPIAYAKYNILNDDKPHINITINEKAEIRNFTLFSKE